MTLKTSLAAIVGEAYCSNDPAVLQGYAHDYSLVQARLPEVVVFPKSADEIQSVIRHAIEQNIAVTPRSSGVGFYGASIPSQGGIIVDLRRMNGILEVDDSLYAVAALDEPPVGVRLDQTDALPSAGDADSERIENLTVCQREVCSPSRDGDQALLGKIGLFAVDVDSEVLRDPHLDRMACGHHFYDNWYT